jgi:hypothetical protein
MSDAGKETAPRDLDKPYLLASFGDPDRIRTCNLPLRRKFISDFNKLKQYIG